MGLRRAGTGPGEGCWIRERINTRAGRGICALEGGAAVLESGDEGREQAETTTVSTRTADQRVNF